MKSINNFESNQSLFSDRMKRLNHFYQVYCQRQTLNILLSIAWLDMNFADFSGAVAIVDRIHLWLHTHIYNIYIYLYFRTVVQVWVLHTYFVYVWLR